MNRGLVDYFRRNVFAGERGLRVAEVACGSGYASHFIAQLPEVALSVAADLNLDDHRQARIVNFRAAFVRMDLFRPALLAGSLDLVWNSSSIEELEEPDIAVRAMAGLVKPGGCVFVGVPNRGGWARLLRVLPGARAWLGRVYTRGELGQLLEAAGLVVERKTSYLLGTFIGMLARKPAAK